ncbi:MAG: hypothetical protein QM796_09160 [Chthoniobacteraceae bacterium]
MNPSPNRTEVSRPSWLGRIVQLDLADSHKRLQFRLGKWFQWSISLSEERGAAGGSIKFSTPFRSPLLSGLLCVGLAFAMGHVSQFITPVIFLCFAVHHFRRWWKSWFRRKEMAMGADFLRQDGREEREVLAVSR